MNPRSYQRAYQAVKQLGKMTTPYGGKTAYENFHPGVDIANKEGTSVPSFVDGTVVKTDTGHKPGENNYGNSVTIQDAQGDMHKYSHLRRAYVTPGQRVHSGQQIAQMGSSGSAYSPSGGDPSHLDYRVVSAFGRYKNPMQYIDRMNHYGK